MVALVLLLLAFITTPLALAIPLGSVISDFGGAEGARAVAIQTDGKIIAVGYQYSLSGFALARYHADGRLDTTFGSGGFVVTSDFLGDNPEGMEVKLQTDGKIVVAGFAGSALNFAVARYNVDGSLDTSFGTGGKVMTNLTGDLRYDLAYTLAIQTDGKIILAGFCHNCGANLLQDFALVRYNPNGTLDATFGSGGIVLTDLNNGSDDRIYAITILGDGKILVGGRTAFGAISGAGKYRFGLARYNINGTLDTLFGTGGLVTYDFGDTAAAGEVRALAITSRGKILAVGPGGLNADFAVVRFNADGSLDTRYGTNGVAYADLGSDDQASAAILQADGNLLVGGYSSNRFAVARFSSAGALDTQFGVGGKVATYLGQSSDFTMKLGMALQGDGKIITAGTVSTNNSNFGLIRYNANGTLDTTFGARADLAITGLSVSPSTVKAGDNLTYTFNVSNTGPDAAPGVTIANQFSLSTAAISCTPSCNLGSVASGASVAVSVVVTPLQVGTLNNTISISSMNMADPAIANNTASVLTTVTGSADLSVAMTASPDPAKVGQALTFVTTVTNNGPDKATLVSLSNSLYGTATSSQGSCSGLLCDLGILNPGASATVSLVAIPSANGTISNTASVTSGVNDPNLANNSTTASATVNSNANLAIAVTATPNPVLVGNNITYAVTVTNQGPDDALDVWATSRLSNNGATVLGLGTCSAGVAYGTYHSCSLYRINAGISVSYSFDASTSATGTVDGTHSVSSEVIPDPDLTNNATTTSTTVSGAANLSVTITDSPDPLMIGNNLTYTITVTNQGPEPAFGTRLSFPLPAQATFVSGVSSQGFCDSAGYCYFGTINSGSSVTATYVVTPLQTGTVSASASVSSNVADPNTADNSATATTTVNGTADIAVTVTDSPDPLRAGSTLTYTTIIRNNGPDAAPVNLSGTIPSGLGSVVVTTTQGACMYASVNCTFGMIANGGSVTVTLSGIPASRGTLTFTPTASTGATDLNPANNSATATTTVK